MNLIYRMSSAKSRPVAGKGSAGRGDGKDDVLWRSDDGMPAPWLMNGLQIAATLPVATAAQAPTDRHIAHHQYDIV
jgi:hypothetical protein